MTTEDKTGSNQKQIAWLVLVVGFLVISFGLFGVWLQSEFWDISTNYLVMEDQVLHSEVVESFCLPTIVTSIGGLAVAWVILASKLMGKFSLKQRNIIFVIFVFVYVLAVFIPAKIAGDKMWKKALEAERKYNTPRSVETNSK